MILCAFVIDCWWISIFLFSNIWMKWNEQNQNAFQYVQFCTTEPLTVSNCTIVFREQTICHNILTTNFMLRSRGLPSSCIALAFEMNKRYQCTICYILKVWQFFGPVSSINCVLPPCWKQHESTWELFVSSSFQIKDSCSWQSHVHTSPWWH